MNNVGGVSKVGEKIVLKWSELKALAGSLLRSRGANFTSPLSGTVVISL